jgi:hypothetical protein
MSRRSLILRLAVVGMVSGSPMAVLCAEKTDALAAAHAGLLERALAGAARKLEQPRCRVLLEEFRDKRGRTLAENLVMWNRSASDYLRMVPFRDGSVHRPCTSGRSTLFTVVGTFPVFVCPNFRKEARDNPWAAENWVIHEMLHTLGLGEDPPSSREITQRVNERCQ